jgi:hypothetical protein
MEALPVVAAPVAETLPVVDEMLPVVEALVVKETLPVV